MVRDRPDVARFLVSRGCQTDILLTTALGDLDRVRQQLDANPACIRTSVSEKYFPKLSPAGGGSIYIWTLGQNKAAHEIAREFGHDNVYRLLLERSPQELKMALAYDLGDEQLFTALLSSRPNFVQTLSDAERRKLSRAAENNTTEAVRLMLAAGWPVEARGQHGGTPLHWAAWHGNARMTQIILQHNPPLECTDTDFGGTPLGWAIHGAKNGGPGRTKEYTATVEALLKSGAKPPKKPKATAR